MEVVRPGFLCGADTRIDLFPFQSKKTQHDENMNNSLLFPQ